MANPTWHVKETQKSRWGESHTNNPLYFENLDLSEMPNPKLIQPIVREQVEATSPGKKEQNMERNPQTKGVD